MVVGCPECNTRYRLDEAKIPAGGRALRCGKCTHVFRVQAPPGPSQGPVTREAVTVSGPPAVAKHAMAAAPAGAELNAAAAGIPAEPAGVPVALATMAGEAARASIAGAAPAPPSPAPPPPAPPSIALALPDDGAGREGGGDPDDPRWIVAGAEGEEILDRPTIRSRIRSGEIDETTLLRSAAGGDPLPAGEVPELGRYFRLKRGATGSTPVAPVRGGFCSAHPTASAEQICTACHTLYCAACVGEKEFGTTRVKWCHKCDDRCMPYEGARNVVPFWREIPRLLVYPLEGWGPFMVLCCALLSTIGAWTPGPGKVLYFFALVYQLHILSESARGQRKLPDWPEVTDFGEITARGMKALLVTLVAWSPVILFNTFLFTNVMNQFSGEMSTMVPPQAFEQGPGGPGMEAGPDGPGVDPQAYVNENGEFDFDSYYADLQAQEGEGFDGSAPEAAPPGPPEGLRGLLAAGALFLVGNLLLVPIVFLYYPMCLMIAAIWNTVLPALNPSLILRCIGRIRADYAMALLFCAVLAIGGFMVQVVFSIIPILGAFVAALVTSYLTFVQMHILGWTAWQGWDRLNWDIQV